MEKKQIRRKKKRAPKPAPRPAPRHAPSPAATLSALPSDLLGQLGQLSSTPDLATISQLSKGIHQGVQRVQKTRREEETKKRCPPGLECLSEEELCRPLCKQGTCSSFIETLLNLRDHPVRIKVGNHSLPAKITLVDISVRDRDDSHFGVTNETDEGLYAFGSDLDATPFEEGHTNEASAWFCDRLQKTKPSMVSNGRIMFEIDFDNVNLRQMDEVEDDPRYVPFWETKKATLEINSSTGTPVKLVTGKVDFSSEVYVIVVDNFNFSRVL
jgi:hypothetical protein